MRSFINTAVANVVVDRMDLTNVVATDVLRNGTPQRECVYSRALEQSSCPAAIKACPATMLRCVILLLERLGIQLGSGSWHSRRPGHVVLGSPGFAVTS